LLLANKYEVVHLSRRENPFVRAKAFKWNVDKAKIDLRAFEDVTHIVHLAGAGIAEAKWTEVRKQKILDSRIKSSEMLWNAIQKTGIQPKAFIGASAIGYYGAVTSDKIYNEQDVPGKDFLGKCCATWEESYEPFTEAGIRTAIIRVGVVLSSSGAR
jgi:uncharacterized protein